MENINVLLVDDHDVVRAGLRSLLDSEEDMTVIGEAANGAEAIERVDELHPDVVVMDITMPIMDGREATRKISSIFPEVIVLSLTVHEDKQYFFEMLACGAKGYITKQAAGEELIAAIRSVASGHVYLQPALARWLIDDYQRLVQSSISREDRSPDFDPAGLDVLSHREQEVLGLVAEGATTPEIGSRLELSPKTVSRHRERIMNKLNLHSTTELVKFAIKTGLVGLD